MARTYIAKNDLDRAAVRPDDGLQPADWRAGPGDAWLRVFNAAAIELAIQIEAYLNRVYGSIA